MKITWDDIVLADDSDFSIAKSNLSVTGRQQVQQATFVRSQRGKWFARGNRSLQVSFNVSRLFGSVADAEQFVVEHYRELSDGARVDVAEGSWPVLLLELEGDEDIEITNAVLESVSEPRYIGCSVELGYSFRVPKIITSASTALTDLDALVTHGTQTIPFGVDEHTFTGLAFASAPIKVIGSIEIPEGADLIFANVVTGSYTTDGFKINLSSITTSSSYLFNFVAVL